MSNMLSFSKQVKNKAPAEVQITAEQLLREAKERELELLPPPPKQKITDEEELNDYKLRKRKVNELCNLCASSPRMKKDIAAAYWSLTQQDTLMLFTSPSTKAHVHSCFNKMQEHVYWHPIELITQPHSSAPQPIKKVIVALRRARASVQTHSPACPCPQLSAHRF